MMSSAGKKLARSNVLFLLLIGSLYHVVYKRQKITHIKEHLEFLNAFFFCHFDYFF